MQSAVSFLWASPSPETGKNSGNFGVNFGLGNSKNQTGGFASVISREMDKTNEYPQTKQFSVRKPEKFTKNTMKNGAKDDAPEQMAAMAAMSAQTERRNNIETPKNDSVETTETNGISATEAENGMEVNTQIATEQEPETQNAFKELLELLSSPEAKEFFNILNTNENQTETTNLDEVIAALKALSQGDDPEMAQLAQKILKTLENNQNELLNRVVDGEFNLMPEIDVTEIDETDSENTVGKNSEMFSVMDFEAKLSRIMRDINNADTQHETVDVSEDAEALENIQRKAVGENVVTDESEAPDNNKVPAESKMPAEAEPQEELSGEALKKPLEKELKETPKETDAPEETVDKPVRNQRVAAENGETDENGDRKQQKNMSGDTKDHGITGKKPIVVNTQSNDSAYIQAMIKAANAQVNQAAASIRSVPAGDVNSVINQIVEKMSLNTSQNMSRMEIQLSPEFMGKLSIILTSTPDGVTASIKAANDSVRAAIAANMTQLENSLKASGINMKDISVTDERTNWDFSRGGQKDAESENLERRAYGENLRNNSKHGSQRGNRISGVRQHNNYNADAVSRMGYPAASLTGSVEFLA